MLLPTESTRLIDAAKMFQSETLTLYIDKKGARFAADYYGNQ
jgi:hypothetical protein